MSQAAEQKRRKTKSAALSSFAAMPNFSESSSDISPGIWCWLAQSPAISKVQLRQKQSKVMKNKGSRNKTGGPWECEIWIIILYLKFTSLVYLQSYMCTWNCLSFCGLRSWSTSKSMYVGWPYTLQSGLEKRGNLNNSGKIQCRSPEFLMYPLCQTPMSLLRGPTNSKRRTMRVKLPSVPTLRLDLSLAEAGSFC